MGYVETVLSSDERVLRLGHLHWVIYSSVLIAALISGCIFLYAETVGPKTAGVVGLLFVLLALVVWIQTWIITATTEIAVTDRRVIVKLGLIRRSTTEMNLRQVESVHVQQTVLGRLLGYGTVIIKGTGSGIEPISKIAEPLQLRQALTSGAIQARRPAERKAPHEIPTKNRLTLARSVRQ